MGNTGRLTHKDRPGCGQASRGRLSCKAKSPRRHEFGGALTSFRGLNCEAVPVRHGNLVGRDSEDYGVGPQTRERKTGPLM